MQVMFLFCIYYFSLSENIDLSVVCMCVCVGGGELVAALIADEGLLNLSFCMQIHQSKLSFT